MSKGSPKHPSNPKAATPTSDATIIDRLAPAWLLPYLKLARIDRPIGTWLLLFPCWWSLALAELTQRQIIPNPDKLILFALGAIAMRGAGCTWNDIIDRKYDAKVARTANRPLPSGAVSVPQAVAFGVFLSLIGLAVLLSFNRFTVFLAIASLALVAIYPFMKRLTDWPQLVLGLGFNWGALVGWASVTGNLSAAPLALYAGAVAWTLGYDTIYAHQDRDDDIKAGLRSSAIRLGAATPTWVAGFYGVAVLFWAIAGWIAGTGVAFVIGLGLVAAHFAWQVQTLDINNGSNCLARFCSNRTVGLIVFIAIVADMVLRAS
ncbi:MAG: 4-hydroxybenzoate octaprenyltransferase [Alphaproteobacteria bacterium]|nr:4-hydroxybenzoate octaprenyltransferase [Alphaproteobacteria bacterium]